MTPFFWAFFVRLFRLFETAWPVVFVLFGLCAVLPFSALARARALLQNGLSPVTL